MSSSAFPLERTLSLPRRFIAGAIDSAVLIPVALVVRLMTSGGVAGSGLLVAITTAYFGVLGRGRTLGMRRMRVEAVLANGGRMTVPRSVGRWLVVVAVFQFDRFAPNALSWLPFAIIFAPALIDGGRRALHDRVFGTLMKAVG